MKCLLLSIVVILLLPLASTASDEDILGNWIADYDRALNPDAVKSRGEMPAIRLETMFSFSVKGSELTGTVTDAQGKAEIREGKIKGNTISFVVIRKIGETKRELRFKAVVSLNEIRFALEFKNTSGPPLEFIARREFQRHGDLPLQPISIPKEDQIVK